MSEDFQPIGKIVRVKFSPASTASNMRESYKIVTDPELNSGYKPKENGLYSPSLGIQDNPKDRCQTCQLLASQCRGHCGSINVPTPVTSPMFTGELQKWLRIICHNCGYCLLSSETLTSIRNIKGGGSIVKEVTAKCTSNTSGKVISCAICGHPQVSVRIDKNLSPHSNRFVRTDTKNRDEEFSIQEAKNVVEMVSDETLRELGVSPDSHPRKFIWDVIKVPPTNIRADTRSAGGKARTNDLTSALQAIIRACNEISSVEGDVEVEEEKNKRHVLNDLVATYINEKATEETKFISLSARLKTKRGRIRANLLGKRVFNIGRSTIVCNCTLKPDEILISQAFAQEVACEMYVQRFNYDFAMMLVHNNAFGKWPMATHIKKAGSNSFIKISCGDTNIECGDMLLRNLIDGDPVDFNRPPTLTTSSITTVRVKVNKNADDKSIGMNVTMCKLFHADFDGDAMTISVSAGQAERTEIAELGSVSCRFLSHTTSSPSMGQVDDGIIGLALLTRSTTVFDRKHAMRLFSTTNIKPIFPKGVKKFTGYDIISFILAPAKALNYECTPTWYNPAFASYINYDEKDITVKIVGGRHISGVLDKRSIGSGAVGGIYHIIANDYGADTAISIMYDMQQVAIAYLAQCGFTVSVEDLLISETAKAEISQAVNRILDRSVEITNQLHRREIIAPMGRTVTEHYNDLQMTNRLYMATDEYAYAMISGINPYTNGFFLLHASGSKGQLVNILNMNSAIGQKVINGEAPAQNLGYKRWTVYARRFDEDAEMRGYIANSYMTGMTPEEFYSNSEANRFDLISKALSTSITGYQNRQSIMALLSAIVSNVFSTIKNANETLQLLYGEIGSNPAYLMKVKIPTIMMSDADFEKKFGVTTESMVPTNAKSAKKSASASTKTRTSGFDPIAYMFKRIKNDRDVYRKVYLAIENNNLKTPFTDVVYSPVDVQRIIKSVLVSRRRSDGEDIEIGVNSGDRLIHTKVARINLHEAITGESDADIEKMGAATLDEKVRYVLRFCDDLHYIFTSSVRRIRRAPAIYGRDTATTMIAMLLRAHLNPSALMDISMAELVEICDKVYTSYAITFVNPGTAVGIIAAQSFSEPLTQYMLDAHHRSASGGTSKNDMVRTQEVTGATVTKNLKSPTMLIALDGEYGTSEAKATQVANVIEMMAFSNFIHGQPEILLENIDNIYDKEERSVTADYVRMKSDTEVKPSTITNWCIRFYLDRLPMVYRGIDITSIAEKLEDTWPGIYVVHTPEGYSGKPWIRVYICNTFSAIGNSGLDMKIMEDVARSIRVTVVRGVDGIISTNVKKLVRHKIDEETGAIVRDGDRYGISTAGTNLSDISRIPGVDIKNVQTDSIHETKEFFGITASRNRITFEMHNLIDSCNHIHYLIYADDMTWTGGLTPVDKNGLRRTEVSDVFRRSASLAPLRVFTDAAINGIVSNIYGVSSPLMVGDSPQYGTNFNTCVYNEKKIQSRMTTTADIISELIA